MSGEEHNGYRTTKRTKVIMVMLVRSGVEEELVQDSITHVGMEGKRP